MLAQLTAETADTSNLAHSPVSAAMTTNASPAASIWTPLASSAGAGWTERFVAYSVPSVQNTGETMSARRPAGSSEPTSPAGQARIATPIRPTTMPAPTSGGTDSRYSAKPKIASHIGTRAMSSAAMPVGMVCSPQATRPGPADEEHRADDRRVAELDPRGPGDPAAVPGDDEERQDQARRHEPEHAHHEHRHGVHGDLHAQVRRAPHDVEHEDADPDGDRVGGRAGHARRLQGRDVRRSVARGGVTCASPIGQVAGRCRRPARRPRQAAASIAVGRHTLHGR